MSEKVAREPLPRRTYIPEDTFYITQPVFEQPQSQENMGEKQAYEMDNDQTPMAMSPHSDPLVHDIGLIFVPNTPNDSRFPVRMQCPHCEVEIVTTTDPSFGCTTCLTVLACLIVCPPLVWIPLVAPNWKDVVHTCPNCRRKLGRHNLCTPQ